MKEYLPTEKLVKVFNEVTASMADTFERKNTDYGNSFFESLDKRGLVAALVRLEDKFNRLDSLKDKDAKVKDESMIDTCLDAANYFVMTAMWLSGRVTDNVRNNVITENKN